MKVLDMSTQMSNVEVLTWIRSKRTQHAHEDAEDKKNNMPSSRPNNFVRALDTHEKHLLSDHYPYKKNPSMYISAEIQDEQILALFTQAYVERIVKPVQIKNKTMVQKGEITMEQARKKMEDSEAAKTLSPSEILMIYNHAPICTEMLQPMIENWDERFEEDEMETLVEIVKEVFRKDEYGKA